MDSEHAIPAEFDMAQFQNTRINPDGGEGFGGKEGGELEGGRSGGLFPQSGPWTTVPDMVTGSTKPRRTFLTEDNKLTLMKLCLVHEAEHRPGKKSAFWVDISERLLQESGIKLRDPHGTVKGLVAARKATLTKHEEMEPGVTVRLENDELSRAVDKWIVHEDDLGVRLQALRAPSVARVAPQTSAAPRLILPTRRGKRRRGSDGDVVSDGELSEGELRPVEQIRQETEACSPGPKRHRVSVVQVMQEKIATSNMNTEKLVAALDRLGETMLRATTTSMNATVNSGERTTTERLNRLERMVEKHTEERKEEQQSIKDMLTLILQKLN